MPLPWPIPLMKDIAVRSVVSGASGIVGVVLVAAASLADVVGLDREGTVGPARVAAGVVGLAAVAFAGMVRSLPRTGALASVLDRRVARSALLARTAQLVGFGALYLLTFGWSEVKIARFWFFGADSMEPVYWSGFESWEAKKHPLLVVAVWPLFHIGRRAFHILGPETSEALAATFPTALIGAINVWLFFHVLRASHGDRRAAWLFSVLYGLSASAWIFHSFPESYALTATTTNLFLLVALRDREPQRVLGKPLWANVLSCFAAPQQILLAVIQGFQLLRMRAPAARVVSFTLRYSLLLLLLYYLPLKLWHAVGDGPVPNTLGYLAEWGSLEGLLDFATYLIVSLNLFLFSVVGPSIHPRHWADPAFSWVGEVDGLWMAAALVASIAAVVHLHGLSRSPAQAARRAPDLLIFLGVTTFFFSFFNAREIPIFALPPLSVWLLVLHAGHVGLGVRQRRLYGTALLVAIVVNNAALIGFLRTLTPVQPP